MALQPLAKRGNTVIKSIDQEPYLLSAMGKGSSKPEGASMLILAY